MLQETACRDYCERQGYVVTAVEADPGISGRTWQRPAVQRVMSAVEEGEADVIVLWRWSRLSRNRRHWAVAADRVDVAGGRLESATEPNDTTAAGRFGRGVMVEMNAFESERIGEQWTEVQKSRFQRGLPPGTVPWGWRYRDDGTIEPHPDQAPAIRQLYDMYLRGDGTTTLARWLEGHGYRTARGNAHWERCTVTSILDSPVHAGLVTYHGETAEGQHDGLIDRSTYDRYKAQRTMRRGKRQPRAAYLLSGLLTCGACGATMYGQTVKNDKHPGRGVYVAYRCENQPYGRDHGPGYASQRRLDDAVETWLREYGALDADLDEPSTMGEPQLEAERLARELQKEEKALLDLTLQLNQGIIPAGAYQLTARHYEERIATVTAALERLEATLALAPEAPTTDARALTETWELTPVKDRRAGLRGLLASITVDLREKKVQITPRMGTPRVMDY
ncbi:recombinase family protein [Microbacterium sp. gxy059]